MRKNTCRSIFLIISAVLLYAQGNFGSISKDLHAVDSNLTDTTVIKDDGHRQHHRKHFHHSLAELLETQEENTKRGENTHEFSGNVSSFSDKLYYPQVQLTNVVLRRTMAELPLDFQALFCTFLI